MKEQDIFVRQAANNLRYWLARTRGLNEHNLEQLEAERDNLRRAAAWALAFPALHDEVGRLLHQSLPLVELRGYWQQWIPLVERAAAQLRDAELRAQLLSDLGFYLRLNDDLDAAIGTFAVAAAAAEATGSHELLAEIHFHLATTHREARAYDDARRFARSAATLFAETGSATPRRRGAIANLLGLIARHEGDNAAAAERFDEAVRLWQSSDDRAYLARALQNRGAVLTNLARYDEALADLDRALPLSTHALVRADIQINRGNIFYARREWREANVAYTEARQLAEDEAGAIQQRAMAETNIAHVYLEQGEPERAEGHLREALALWERLGDEVMLANALGALAEAVAAQSQFNEARQHYQRAMHMVEQYPADAFASELRASFVEGLAKLNGGQRHRQPDFEL